MRRDTRLTKRANYWSALIGTVVVLGIMKIILLPRYAGCGEPAGRPGRASPSPTTRDGPPTLIAGSLAGPAWENRPPVPVWEYLDYQRAHPDISLDQIAATRFPVKIYGGDIMPTSLAEHIGTWSGASRILTLEDIVAYFRIKHERGALDWDKGEPDAYRVPPPDRISRPAASRGARLPAVRSQAIAGAQRQEREA